MDLSVPAQRAEVAIVEGDVYLRDALAAFLCAQRYRVTTYGSAEEALAAGSLEQFGILISDLSLPGESGLVLLRRARAASQTQGTMLITGSEEGDLQSASARLGVDALLRKPVSGEELGSALEMLSNRSAGPHTPPESSSKD